MRPPARAVGLLAVGMALLTGCGDDGGGAASGRAEYVDAFDSICTGIADDLNELSGDDTVADAQRAVDLTDAGLAELSELTPPAELADDVTSVLGGLADIRDGFAALGEAVEAGDADAEVAAATELEGAIADTAAKVDAVGLDCGFAEPDSASSTTPDSSALPPSDEPSEVIEEYGTEGILDAEADGCAEGDLEACDALYLQSDLESGYEAYGETCGGRNQPSGPCVDLYASR